MVGGPGLDLHDWQTRWEELREAAVEDPAGTLPDIVRLIDEMLSERSFQLDEPITAEGQDPDIIRDFLAAREVADAVNAGNEEPGDVAAALENLREIYDYLIADRRPR